MLRDWFYIIVYAVIAVSLPAAAIFVAGLLAPKKPNKIKNTTYECGIETVGDARAQVKVQYYIFGLIFLLFDVEVVLLYPWAVAYNQIPLYAVLEGVLFILILAGGLLWAWKKGTFEWN